MSFSNLFEKGSYTLLAAPEQMGEKSAELRCICDELIRHINTAKGQLLSIKSFWDTPGAESMTEILQDELSETDAVCAGLKETVADLDAVIRVYREAEKANVEESMGLPESIIY